jgi:glycosyltransferase involved in cell wall biosynthesis
MLRGMEVQGQSETAKIPGARQSAVIAHDFVETYGGAERIVATMASALPDAPFWVIGGRRSVAERIGVADRFHTLLPENEQFLSHHRMMAPIYPRLVRHRPLPAADVLLTSSYGFAHGFRTENGAPQVCYCYSPLRFLWSMTDVYSRRFAPGRLRRQLFRVMAAIMRRADKRAAGRVTRYIAESTHVARIIGRAYGRDAAVLHPPVDCDRFHPAEDGDHDDYWLFSGRLVEPYKRPGLVVDAFRERNDRLVIAGDGPAYAELKERASDNVEFVGQLGDSELLPLMQRCTATIFPSVDDFGLSAVETMACGRPVLAFGAGGALETVVPGQTGEFFHEPSVPGLLRALDHFDPEAFDPRATRAHAEKWDVPRFQEQLVQTLRDVATGPPPSRAAPSPVSTW